MTPAYDQHGIRIWPGDAIASFCAMCLGWADLSESCANPACPLYRYRGR